MKTRDHQHDDTGEVDDLREPVSDLDPAHVVVATHDEEFMWSVFDGFSEMSSIRVTGCSSLAQTQQICGTDPPGFLVIDMLMVENEPMALMTIANLSGYATHIIALTEHPVFEIGARFGDARLTFMQKPISAHDLLLLLRLKLEDVDPGSADAC